MKLNDHARRRRRRRWTAALAALVVWLGPASAWHDAALRAQDSPTITPQGEWTPIEQVSASLDRALEYLAHAQQPSGRWHLNNAMNALTLLAFMGHGHVPGRGPYREIIGRGKQYLLSTQDARGYFGNQDNGRMYAHALATLALAELYGMDDDPRVEAALRKAIDLIVTSQSPAGGWRYTPDPNQGEDMSVTIMQVVALRAANNAEIPVPEVTINKAIRYVRACGSPNGGFAYQGPGRNTQLTGAGVLALYLLNAHQDPKTGKLDPRVVNSAEWLVGAVTARWGGGFNYFSYGHYYTMQAMYQAGGKYWDLWHPRVRDMFLSQQNNDGSWNPVGVEGKYGKAYATPMACLVLEVYMHYLPAYQR